MLAVKEIHFLLDQDLNSGAFQNRTFEPEEFDEAINAEVFRLTNVALTKIAETEKEVILENNEKILLRELTKSFCSTPVNGQIDLPKDYSFKINAKTTIYRTDCGRSIPVEIKEGMTLQASGAVKYNGVWYKDGDTFSVKELPKNLYGKVFQLPSNQQDGVFVENEVFNSFSDKSVIGTVYTIIGNKIQLKSKFPILTFCLNYISNVGSEFKMDSCNNKTLNFTETLQRWIIDRTVLRLAARNEESQQKIENFRKI